MQIRIEQAKGKKDRYTLLSVRLLEVLRKHFIAYKPKVWLFEGVTGGQYSIRSILLGHVSSKTTEIYTHITTKGFDQIKSPLDRLDNF